MLLLIALASAQDAAAPHLSVAMDPTHGSYLVDGDGFAVYAFAADEGGVPTCVDACADAWPPVVADQALVAGAGVAASLMSAVERPDGTLQLAYFGLPLYRFAGDTEAGMTAGQGINDAWFLVSNYGSVIVPKKPEVVAEPADEREPIEPMLLSQMTSEGNALFSQYCSGCHGASGQGVNGPALAGADLSDDRAVLRQILRGSGHMPGFGSILTDFQAASVVTYVRGAWGNAFAPFVEEDVAQYR